MTATVTALWRHPLKGFPAEALDSVRLSAGAPFPQDRLFAIENGPSGFDSEAPAHLPKTKFLMLMRHGRLTTFRLRWDDVGSRLDLADGTGRTVTADPFTSEGRAALEAFISAACAAELTGAPRFLVAPEGHRFMDSRKGFVSILNAGSIAAVEAIAGRPVDPRRFRGNILMRDMPAWSEFDLVGRRFRIGAATFVGLARIDRCAATDVDPETGERDIPMVLLLERHLHHHDCGIYARVESGGPIAPGDTLTDLGPVPAGAGPLPF